MSIRKLMGKLSSKDLEELAKCPLAKKEDIDFVIYHGGCSDGYGSAFAAWKYNLSRNKSERKDIQYFAAYHGTSSPPNVSGKHVGIFDYSYSADILKTMKDQAASLIILDHHITAQKALKNELNAKFNMKKSGARLAWEYFFPGEDVPSIILYIEDRDLFLHKLDRSKEFTAAFDLVPKKFEAYDLYMDEKVMEKAKKDGSIIVESNNAAIGRIMTTSGIRQLKGKEIWIANNNNISLTSDLGNELAKASKSGLGLVYYYDSKRSLWLCSLRSTPGVDCSKIATELGGGGHKTASAFRHKGASIEEIFD